MLHVLNGDALAVGPGGGPHAADALSPVVDARGRGEHFAAAAGFLVLGAAALVWRAPALAAGAFSDPGVIAATHLFTLGWIGTSLIGATLRFLPAGMGAPLRGDRLVPVTLAAWVAGVLVFVAGLSVGEPAIHLTGAGAVGLACLAFVAILAASLRGAPGRGLAWWCLAGGGVALLGGWLLGFLLAVNLGTGMLGGSRYTVLAVHFHIAAAGWVLLTLIGLARPLLPRVSPGPEVSRLPGRVAAALVGTGTLGLLLSEHLLGPWVLRAARWVIAAGAAAFLLQAVLHYKRYHRARRRSGRQPEPGLRLVAGSLLLLAAAVGLGLGATAPGGPRPVLATAYGVALLPGGFGLYVAGHYCALLRLPSGGRAAGGLLLAGAAGLVVATLAGSSGATRAAALAYAAGSLILALEVVRALRRGAVRRSPVPGTGDPRPGTFSPGSRAGPRNPR